MRVHHNICCNYVQGSFFYFPSGVAKPQKVSLEPPEANAVRENVPESEATPAETESERGPELLAAHA